MDIKKITIFGAILLFLIVLLCIILTSKQKKTTIQRIANEDIKDFYVENKQLLYCIKKGLLESDFDPCDGRTANGFDSRKVSSIYLQFDDNQLKCIDDSNGGKLQSIKKVHDKAVDYFMQINEKYDPGIRYSILLGDIVVMFSYYRKGDDDIGIINTNIPESIGFDKLDHIEGDWYIYRFHTE